MSDTEMKKKTEAKKSKVPHAVMKILTTSDGCDGWKWGVER